MAKEISGNICPECERHGLYVASGPFWGFRCNHCGYTARNTAGAADVDAAILQSSEQQSVMGLVFRKFLVEYQRQADKELVGKEGGAAMAQAMSAEEQSAHEEVTKRIEARGGHAQVALALALTAAAVSLTASATGAPVRSAAPATAQAAVAEPPGSLAAEIMRALARSDHEDLEAWVECINAILEYLREILETANEMLQQAAAAKAALSAAGP